MLRTSLVLARTQRRGIILLVVITLLTLFAVVGLSFVLYANAQATASRFFREAETTSRPDMDPELLLAYFLGQLVYDVRDDRTGVYSALRGHSLSRNMYGLNYTLGDTAEQIAVKNAVPWSGTGRLHFDSALGPLGPNDYFLINYTYFAADGFLRDPERYRWRSGLATASQENRGRYLGSGNAPYTYPDLNSLFLAAVKADGTVLTPSFHRDWLFRHPKLSAAVSSLNSQNPHWQTQEGKYLLLRPRPKEMGPGFPYPEDDGGDVKNLLGTPGGNDSLWLDLDAPVLIGPDGRKFKALFAPLVLDLDNRVNLNVHGNLRGLKNANQASNSGWGAWEVNPARVLDKDTTEWTALLQGNVAQAGRYGRDTRPHTPMPAEPVTLAHTYAPMDFDGSQELANGAPSRPLQLPGTGPSLPYQCFPTIPTGYGMGSQQERTGHPRLYNPFRPTPPDRTFALSDLEALLRYGDTGSPALTSELFSLCPQNFGDRSKPADAARRRGLVTLRSFDLDQPGITPWFWPINASAYLRLPALAAYPVGNALPFPPLASLMGPSAVGSEFGPDGRAAADLTALGRLDLNRYLPDYPKPDATGQITDLVGFAVAQQARQYFAAEIFERLWRLSGAGNPYLPAALPPPGVSNHNAERWNALRWLAQLAVNIVDYIDTDDCMTPFNWYPPYPGNPAGEWVYGTELPRLVLNEAYVQVDNDPLDGLLATTHKASHYVVNAWVELFNPLSNDATLTNQGAAVLQVPTHAVYQVVLSPQEPSLRTDPSNVRGDPAHAVRVVGLFGPNPATWIVQPANGGYAGPSGGNAGFYVLGPEVLFLEGANPNLPATILSPGMTYPVSAATHVLPRPTILLRRLACPQLRPNAPELPNYDASYPLNPYVTVDYLELNDVPVNDGRLFDDQGAHLPLPLAKRASWARCQPYAGARAHLVAQSPLGAPPNQPHHTFFRHNAREPVAPPSAKTPGQTLTIPFSWLVHLDRPLISPMELLQVSAYKPHELTQQFVGGDAARPRPYMHRVPWFEESHRLYRVLEFLGTHNQTLGMMTAVTQSLDSIPLQGQDIPFRPLALSGRTATGGSWRIGVGSSLVIDKGLPTEEVVRVKAFVPSLGPATSDHFTADFLKPHAANFTITPTLISERIPGKINLNTVWDEETFQALCDAQPSNHFTKADVTAIFNQLLKSRTKDKLGRADRPFRSLATGLTPYNDTQFPSGGIEDTLLRAISEDPDRRLFELAAPTHPYQRLELLTKIFNNVTVRSNVFAVWLTVGFFEVTEDASRPVKLGAELGRTENRQVRHRMFAIVDRSALTANPGPQPRFNPRAAPSAGAPDGQVVPYLSIID
jgi:hypothetical protein